MAVLAVFPLFKFFYGNQLTFSSEPGYYDAPFYLSIYGGGKNTIHYTLDGREPTVNDLVFDKESPLYIEDASNHPNVYSARTDTSAGLQQDLIDQYSTAFPYIGYTAPAYLVDKCTIIRASLFDPDGNCLDSITGTYFVGFQDRRSYQDIYTASIVTSPENLFDDDIGIYVLGNTFAECLKGDITRDDLWYSFQWRYWPANFFNYGIDWEREADLTIFDNHQNAVLSEKCGIRIKGGATRGQLPRSISCYARDIYGGSNSFDANIFQTDSFPHKIVLFAGGDDNCFKLKDYLVNTMAQDLHFATMDFIPCAMFLDGEYWGMYYITEDYNADYIHDHYQVANSNVIMIKNYDLAAGLEEDFQAFDEMRFFMYDHDMSDPEAYHQARELIDIDSFIDYYALHIYIGGWYDWPGSNFALWRTRANDGSRYGDGKWRWMLFDINSSEMVLSDDSLSRVLEEDRIFSSLYQNEEFRRQFTERLLYIGKDVFAPETCNLFIDQYVQTMREPLAASNMRFYMDDKSDEFEQYVTNMRTFFAERYDVVWNFLENSMGEEWLAQNGIQK